MTYLSVDPSVLQIVVVVSSCGASPSPPEWLILGHGILRLRTLNTLCTSSAGGWQTIRLTFEGVNSVHR
jgi:hypothetical protein